MKSLLNPAIGQFLRAAALVGIAACFAACSTKTTAGSAVTPVIPAGTGSGDATGSDPAPVALTLGTEVEAKGDVVKDENGMFSLTRTYTLTLEKESSLQVRKTMANGNCGAPNASFIFLQGENQTADVTIDHTKDYNGVPAEKLGAPLAAGTYNVIAFMTLDEECKDMMFFYDFVVEAAK